MRRAASRLLALMSLVLMSVAVAYAENYGTSGQGTESHMGGSATTGTGVRTGKGPLSYPVPPAASTLNNQDPNRPQNSRGPTMTSPSPHPFGTSR